MKLYQNPHHPVGARVAHLLSLMTLDEKIAQLGSLWLILDKTGKHKALRSPTHTNNHSKSATREMKDGLGHISRPLGSHRVNADEGVLALNELQRFLVEETRLGIPAIPHEESLTGLMVQGATLFPSSLNYGHTWDPELIKQVAQAIREQAKKVGMTQGLAPVLDVSRDIRWGRTEETMGEDPYLIGVLGTEYVKGLQGEKRDMSATLKHYVGCSFAEGGRNHAPVNIGFKALNDTFLLPFEMAIKLGKASSVMPAYNDIDNEPCHASQFLLTDILRKKWGFDGTIVADYTGVELLHSYYAIAEDNVEATALAFNAGVDIELPNNTCSSRIKDAMVRGLITEDKLDEIVSRILKTKFNMGLFEQPYIDIPDKDLRTKTAQEIAYRVACKSIVLTENNGILPLDKKLSLAVIGATANDELALLNSYSYPIHLYSDNQKYKKVCPTILDALGHVFPHIHYAKGIDILTKREAHTFPSGLNITHTETENKLISQDTSHITDAINTTQTSDIILVCVGDLSGQFQTGTVGEGSDTDSLNLPGAQQALITAALETGKPVIVLITGGRPYNLQGAEDKVAAVLYAWQPGEEGARAIADILSGEVSPSGRLTLSIPKSVGALPYYYNHKQKSAGTPTSYHFGSKYNFGYGLSYTQFVYSNMRLKQQTLSLNDTIEVSIDIKNTGKIKSDEVVQLYVRDCCCEYVRPMRELKGFKRITLDAGSAKRIIFSLPTDMLNYTNNYHERVVAPGDFEIMIGRSSTQIEDKIKITLTGSEKRILEKKWRMLCHTHDELLSSE